MPGTAAGTAAEATTALGVVVAACEPPGPVAVTTRETVEPMSPGESTYVDETAPAIAPHVAPVGSQRRHWYANDVGEPDHSPTDADSCWPAVMSPETDGGVVATGCVALPVPPEPMATVGGDAADAVPPEPCAVTRRTSACPASPAVGLYVSPVAPAIGTQLPPAASHCSHWYVNETGLPPAHEPGTPASVTPFFAAPTIVGGTLALGGPDAYGAIAIGPGSSPTYRSPSTQWRKPVTFAQSVHCQNVQPSPPQLLAGTDGARSSSSARPTAGSRRARSSPCW